MFEQAENEGFNIQYLKGVRELLFFFVEGILFKKVTDLNSSF